jgi:hypothetical protein
MIWVAWRQFRAQVIISGCVLAIFAVAIVVSGISLAHLYNTSGLPGCSSHGDCATVLKTFTAQLRGSIYQAVLYAGIILTYVAPAVMGAFWAAPMITREFETGTFRLAWTQSVSRNRWLLVKVGMVGLAAMVVAGLLSVMLTWWSGPVYKAAHYAAPGTGLSTNRLVPLLFGVNGIAPIGYAAFAFAVGLTAGVLLRRTVPAMAVTLASFAFVQVAWPIWVRPHLIPPDHSTSPLDLSALGGLFIGNNNNEMVIQPVANKPDAWVISDQAVNSAGHVFNGPATHACVDGSQQACNASIVSLHLRQLVVYQPASRYWELQSYETAIFIVAAVALALFCMTRLSRRRLA